jgi:hypothetical protein
MGKNAGIFISNNFSWDKITHDFSKLIKNIYEEK